MEASDFELIFAALEEAEVRYLVVGGVAVVLHGHPRFTADLDLVVWLEQGNLTRLTDALTSLDYRPRAPVPLKDFADEEIRRSWVEDKGLTVFSLWSPRFSATEIDVFVEEPFDFDVAYEQSHRVLLGDISVTVLSIEGLIALKRKAGRPRDVEDVRALEALRAMMDQDEEGA